MKCFKQSLVSLPSLETLERLFTVCEQHDGYPIKNYWHILRERLRDHQAFDFLCLVDGELVGAVNTFFFDNSVELVIFVHPHFRQQGIAKKLVQITLTKLRQYIVPAYSFIVAEQSTDLLEKCQILGGKYHHSEVEMRAPSQLPALILPSVYLRQATVADVDAIALIHEYSFDQPDRALMAKRFTDALKESWRKIWLMYDDKETLVGKLHLREDFNRVVLHDIGILPDYRQKNYGKALMLNWLAQFAQDYSKPLVVEVLGDNTAGLRLYEACDFHYTNRYQFWQFPFNR